MFKTSSPDHIVPPCQFEFQDPILRIDKLVAADPRIIDGVVAEIIEQIDRIDHYQAIERIRLALSEALANAIRHGCRSHPTCKVRICGVLESSGTLSVSIADPGSGFTLRDVRDPLNSVNLLAGNGRGIFLMTQMADGVRARFQQGSEVYLHWGPLSKPPVADWDRLLNLSRLWQYEPQRASAN